MLQQMASSSATDVGRRWLAAFGGARLLPGLLFEVTVAVQALVRQVSLRRLSCTTPFYRRLVKTTSMWGELKFTEPVQVSAIPASFKRFQTAMTADQKTIHLF